MVYFSLCSSSWVLLASFILLPSLVLSSSYWVVQHLVLHQQWSVSSFLLSWVGSSFAWVLPSSSWAWLFSSSFCWFLRVTIKYIQKIGFDELNNTHNGVFTLSPSVSSFDFFGGALRFDDDTDLSDIYKYTE
jgi:hypothetical protein